VANILAQKINSTLLSAATAVKQNISIQNYPSILPSVQVYESSGVNLDNTWSKYRQPSRVYFEDLFLMRLSSIGFNFGYCEIPRLKFENPWNLTALLNAFDIYIWITLVTSIVALSITIYFKVLIFSKGEKISEIFKYFISLISALIGTGVTPLLVQNVKIKSSLFVLWMFVCIIIINYYTGSITSLMIVPPEEDAMTIISQAIQRNYTLLFDDPYFFRILNASIQNMTMGHSNEDHILDNDDLDIKSVKYLLDISGNESMSVIANKTKFIENFVFYRKVMILGLFT